MQGLLAVGGSFGRMGSSGWDAWPLVGIVVAVWVCRRVLDIPWGPPLLVASLAASLLLPPLVHAWGVVAAAAAVVLLAAAIRAARSRRLRNPPETV